jgi:hypothetical protein
MTNQLTSNAEALRLFFTDDVYLVKNDTKIPAAKAVNVMPDVPLSKIEDAPEKQEVSPPSVAEPTIDEAKQWSFDYLGKNQKGILILVNDQTNKVSSPQGTE